MAPTTKPEGQLNINLSGLNTISEPPTVPTTKSPFGGPKSSGLTGLSGSRAGAGSPLHEQTSRLFPKRTRELQSQTTGLSSNIWGPPTSGTSTPLFEIPESPSQDGFPDLVPLTETGINSPARRGRAGTLPSRISPVGTINGVNVLTSKTSRPTPSTSPFRPGSTSAAETAFYSNASSSANSANSALLSRLRAGSMPQRASLLGQSSSFGQGAFNSGWGTRTRAATLTSISSAEDPTSPQQSGLNMSDSGVRTLDYLGLAEPPPQSRFSDAMRHDGNDPSRTQDSGLSDVLASFGMRNSGRFRSFSVNTQPKYGNEGQDDDHAHTQYPSGTLTPSAAAALEAEYERVQEKVRLHNQAVQAFAVNASAARPRARTAGLVETPQRTSLRHLVRPDDTDATNMGFDMQSSNGMEEAALSDALQGLNIIEHGQLPYETMEDPEVQPSRSLWIGSIPNSTTMSSLDAIFSRFGPIESTRVLTHKNCGFVNFESVEPAIRARHLLNGQEIFPGAGPVRIGFAKAPNASVSLTPNQNSTPPPGSQAVTGSLETSRGKDGNVGTTGATNAEQTLSQPTGDRLAELQPEILQIVLDFGGQQSDLPSVSANLESAIRYQKLEREIPPIPEPSAARMYDAPRLRDIRKRIDNGACGLQEIEQIAIDMLPEIAELSSDYLGNTVVQKLFEYCSEQTKEQMLTRIAPHLAEIGVHKNGTWAAQKIIDVCKTESQTRMIVDALRPYTVALFLDQYGNYVLQCCLRFGSPYNDFIFETMLSQLWEIAQGRFGARAMRACLESHHSTKNQQRMMAAAIALHSVQLAQNANGALLLTWLLDTCTFPRRRSVLTPRLIPHLVPLCTHKVAYLIVLKVINQRNEPEARDMVLKALFFSPNDAVLEQILCDQTSGVTLIFKILTTPFLDDNMRPEVVQNVARVLTKIKAQPNQGYKRIMDEVGMSMRPNQVPAPQYPAHAHPSTNDRGRPPTHAQQASGSGLPPPNFPRQSNGGFGPGANANAFENGMSPVRTGSAESFGLAPYGVNGFQGQQPYSQLPYQQVTPQTQYQNFPNQGPRSSTGYMSSGYTGFATPPSVDPFRTLQNPSSSPLSFSAHMSPVIGSAGFPGQNYLPTGPNNVYNYPQQQQFFYSPPVQTGYSGGRGRRVSQDSEAYCVRRLTLISRDRCYRHRTYL
ncbi:Pumilio domain-containing protein C56F2.08c [Exophiala dermatitidis]